MSERGRIRITNYHGKIFYRLIDCLVILGALYIAIKANAHTVTLGYVSAGLMGVIIYSFIAESLDIYSHWRTAKLRSLALYTSFCWFSTVGGLTLLSYFSKTGPDFSRLIIGCWIVSTFAALLIWRAFAFTALYYLHQRGVHTKKAAIIGLTPQGLELSKNLNSHPELGIQLTGFYDDREPKRLSSDLPILGTIKDAIALAKNGEVQNTERSPHNFPKAQPCLNRF